MTSISPTRVLNQKSQKLQASSIIKDGALKFDTHIEYIYKSVSNYVGKFYKLVYKLPYFCLKKIYIIIILLLLVIHT